MTENVTRPLQLLIFNDFIFVYLKIGFFILIFSQFEEPELGRGWPDYWYHLYAGSTNVIVKTTRYVIIVHWSNE